MQAQQKALQLQYDRLNGVAKSKPGLVAQQEVDDSQGKALASAAQVEAAKSNLQSAESVLAAAQAKREHDQALFDYSKITAPFAGVVTQRFANLGTLMQAGTNSSTQAHAAGPALPGRLFPAGDSRARVVRSIHPSRRSGQRKCTLAKPNISRQSGPLLRGRPGRHPHHAHRSGCAKSQPRTASRAFMRKRPSSWNTRRMRSRFRCRLSIRGTTTRCMWSLRRTRLRCVR